jgi:hypothetical protein
MRDTTKSHVPAFRDASMRDTTKSHVPAFRDASMRDTTKCHVPAFRDASMRDTTKSHVPAFRDASMRDTTKSHVPDQKLFKTANKLTKVRTERFLIWASSYYYFSGATAQRGSGPSRSLFQQNATLPAFSSKIYCSDSKLTLALDPYLWNNHPPFMAVSTFSLR